MFYQINLLLGIVSSYWKSGSSASADVSTVEILRVMLSVHFLLAPASILCINFIQKGIITGKTAIYCISEVIARINVLASYDQDQVYQIADAVIAPFSTFDSVLGADNNSFGFNRLCSCLGIIPPAIHALRALTSKHENTPLTANKSILIIDSILDHNWHPESALSLANTLADIYSLLRKKNIRKFKVQSNFVVHIDRCICSKLFVYIIYCLKMI